MEINDWVIDDGVSVIDRHVLEEERQEESEGLLSHNLSHLLGLIFINFYF